MRDLQPLLQSPQVGLAAKAALIYASGYAEDHDKEVAVSKLATELDVSLPFGKSLPWLTQLCLHAIRLRHSIVQEQAVAAPASALLQLAMFLWHTGSQERARACIEHAFDDAPGDAAGMSLLGWILVHATAGNCIEPEAADIDHASSLFIDVLQTSPKHVEVHTPDGL